MAHAVALNTHTGEFHAPLDPARIVGQAAAIAINAALLLLLLAPLSAPPLPPAVEEVVTVLQIPRRTPQTVTIQTEPNRSRPQPVPVTSQPRTAPPAVEPVVADSQPGDEVAPPFTPVEADVPVSIEPPASSGSHLQTINAPPPSYPPQAVREGLTGVVELEILVDIDGKPLEQPTPENAMDAGMAFLTEDRRVEGLLMEGAIADNIALPSLPRYASGWSRLIERTRLGDDVDRMGREVTINARDLVTTLAKNLSGGNQQKVMLGR